MVVNKNRNINPNTSIKYHNFKTVVYKQSVEFCVAAGVVFVGPKMTPNLIC